MSRLVKRPISNIPPSQLAETRDHLFGPIEEQFNKFFNDFFNVPRQIQSQGFPKVDVYEHEDVFVVQCAIAGVDPDDVNIEIKEEDDPEWSGYYGTQKVRRLRIAGKMDQAFETKEGTNYHVREMSRKSFSRSMILPDYVTSDPIASYRNGMLTLMFDLPKKEPVKPLVKTIQISKEDKWVSE